MTDTITFSVRYARIVTPTTTWAKYALAVDPNGTATVRHPRDVQPVAALTDAQVVQHARGWRIEGINPGGHLEVWAADDLGCGCRDATHEYPTAREEVPT